MRLRDIEKQAVLFEVSLTYAVAARFRCLRQEMLYWFIVDDMDQMSWDVIGKPRLKEIFKEIELLKRDLRWRNRPKKEGDITPDMIEKARAYPIDQLIEFKRKVAKCINPEHEDKHPSMAWLNRINKARCHSCNTTWDSIGVLMTRDGLPFHQAVLGLQ